MATISISAMATVSHILPHANINSEFHLEINITKKHNKCNFYHGIRKANAVKLQYISFIVRQYWWLSSWLSCTHTQKNKAPDRGESSPVELSLKVLHVVMALGIVSGLSLRKVMQTAQVVKLQEEKT